MAQIDSSIVQCNVVLDRPTTPKAGFGIGIFVIPHTEFSDKYRVYSSLSDVSDDFPSQSPVYKALQAYFNQNPHASQGAVGRIQNGIQKIVVDSSVADGDILAVEVNGTYVHVHLADFTYAASSGTTGAGTSSIKFLGTADDAAHFRAGDSFAYSGDTTSAANGIYTVGTGGATHLAGTVTVPVDETIVAATWDGDLDLAVDANDAAEALSDALNANPTIAAIGAATHVAGNAYLLFTFSSPTTFKTVKVGTETNSAFDEDWSLLSIDWLYQIQAMTDADREAAWQDGLDDIQEENSNFWAVAIGATAKKDQDYVAEWAAAQRKLFVARTSDANCKDLTAAADTSTILYSLKAANYNNSAAIYHSQADQTSDDEYVDMAWIGARLWVDPDVQTTTWFNVTLIGITADDLTPTERTNISAKNGSFYASNGAQDITYGSTVADGNYIDTILGAHWMATRCEERILDTLHQASQKGQKIPFTQDGIDILAARAETVITSGLASGFLFADLDTWPERGYEVVVPQLADVDATDRSVYRLLKGLRLRCSAAGAIHKATPITIDLRV